MPISLKIKLILSLVGGPLYILLGAYSFALHHVATSRLLFMAGIVSIIYGTVIAILSSRKG